MSTPTRAFMSYDNSMNINHTTSSSNKPSIPSSLSNVSNSSINKLIPSNTHLIPIDEFSCAIIKPSIGKSENKIIRVEKQIENKKHENIANYSKRMSACPDQYLEIFASRMTRNNSNNNNCDDKIEKECFIENGYIVLNKICDTLQGVMYNAKSSDGQQVVIKKTDKILYDKRISIQDGMSVVVEENIIKEAIILNHLTVDNKPTNEYIAQFIELFESENAFYLVMEKAGDINLAEFNKKAHQLIAEKKMKLKNWKKIVKYIFWQLSTIIYWLHNDMNCCHLELKLKNIMVENGNFICNKQDGIYSVNPNLKIKLIDFGLSEIFETGDSFEDEHDDPDDEYFGNPFECLKFGITDKHYLSPPKVFSDNRFDARKADIWACGIILYELAIGCEPYKSPNINDKAFYKIKHQNIMQLIEINNKTKNVNGKMVNLMCNLLSIRENERYNCCDILKHEWLALYYNKYKSQIDKKSQHQILRNKAMQNKMEIFPYYKAVEF